ncbi:MAG TPA: N-acetylmuramoyl-L-alanine amidase [Bacilli bacterium]|nr:N-acetylmuramoyl-L-alanine amidase [Bacilli bacterium]
MNKKILFFTLLIFYIILYGCNKQHNLNENPIEEEPFEENPVEVTMDEVKTWLIDQYNHYRVTSNIVFPTTDDSGQAKIETISFERKYLTNQGEFTAPMFDLEAEVMFIIDMEEETDDVIVTLILQGYGDEFDETMAWLEDVIPQKILGDFTFPEKYTQTGANLTWHSSNEEAITSKGKVTRNTDQDKGVLLSCEIEIDGEVKLFTKYVYVLGRTDKEKIEIVKKWLDERYAIGYIDENTEFVTTDEVYQSKIIWTSQNESIVTKKLEYIQPLYDTKIGFSVAIGIGASSTSFNYIFHVKGKEYEDMWSKIEDFLDKINLSQIKTQKFYLYGYEVGYQTVPSENIGYLPFYDEKEMEIIQSILPDSSSLKPNRMRSATKYIVIHNTGMAHPTATAKGLNEYIHSTTRVASWHFSIDDKETYQQLKLGEVGWHAGESNGNNYGIGIESCVYQGVDFNMVLRRLAKLSAKLLILYNLDLTDMKQHYDFSGKDCPQVIRHAGRWSELLYLIQLEYFAQTELQGVEFVWKSLTPEIMDDEGRVISHPGKEIALDYQVTVTFAGKTKVFTYTSTLQERAK